MKCFAAHYLYIGSGILEKNQFILISDDCIVKETGHLVLEMPSTVFFNGIICAAFSLPGEKKPASDPDDVLRWMFEALINDPGLKIPECLKNHGNVPEIKPGKQITLWCIENPDFRTMRLKESSKIKVIYS